MDIIKTIRNIKSDMNIPFSKEIDLFISINKDDDLFTLIQENIVYIEALIKIKELKIGTSIEKPPYSVTGILEGIEIYIPLQKLIDIEEEKNRLKKRLTKIKIELVTSQKKLKNRDFLSRAPEEVIMKEKEKSRELGDIVARLENHLKNLQ